ncbi:hypothetical protein MLD38_013673 [Melastoma candidum]|uniref:Uncharacterized protein n=1 Tax=Melastoma candidum TaxID=119954 RepID=A0ACB9RAB1_9MYRT|nr:hypothetical protein MLD38_013673 [Melastoma candidum]
MGVRRSEVENEEAHPPKTSIHVPITPTTTTRKKSHLPYFPPPSSSVCVRAEVVRVKRVVGFLWGGGKGREGKGEAWHKPFEHRKEKRRGHIRVVDATRKGGGASDDVMTTALVPILSEHKSKSYLITFFIGAALVCGAYFLSDAFMMKEYKDKISMWFTTQYRQSNVSAPGETKTVRAVSDPCKDQRRPLGSESLPKGIIVEKSNLEMRPLWGFPEDNKKGKSRPRKNLLVLAVGIKQKGIVDHVVRKFLTANFVVMLFHYDGIVDEWSHLSWSHQAIHVSAVNQTKWWFAKRFLHPDIVSEYDYIFLWDEDLGVEYFDPNMYLRIIKEEGLEISQPALDPAKSVIHHPISVRVRGSKVHRRMFKYKGREKCTNKSSAPPCVGWVEMMAPVFSGRAWRCSWYMIQNDLIHAWGLDKLLGYCAQGDRTLNIGVVDSQYIVHLGLPTLGGNKSEADIPANATDGRMEVRRQSFNEMQILKRRWGDAAKEDRCWVDPYPVPANETKPGNSPHAR